MKSINYILSVFVLSSFLSCKRDPGSSHKNNPVPKQAEERKVHQAEVFMAYLDSVVKLPDTGFNEEGLRSLNRRFLTELPLVMHDSLTEDNRKDILIQYYRNSERSLEVGSGIIFLIPEAISDSLVVADFTAYFGRIKNEEPLIGITEQPRPLHILVSSNREVKLTIKNNENRDQAGVTVVEILNLKKME